MALMYCCRRYMGFFLFFGVFLGGCLVVFWGCVGVSFFFSSSLLVGSVVFFCFVVGVVFFFLFFLLLVVFFFWCWIFLWRATQSR